jgi:hypothetical protein
MYVERHTIAVILFPHRMFRRCSGLQHMYKMYLQGSPECALCKPISDDLLLTWYIQPKFDD